MDKATLATAREDWAWCDPRKDETFCGDDLIALAVGFRRQTRQETAGLTKEDAAIMARRAPLSAFNAAGNVVSMSNDLPTLRYLINLNA